MSDLGNKILDLEMGANDAGASTIRWYLRFLLRDLWKMGEGFDSKRPFGNSNWEQELYYTLYRQGLIVGEVDEWEEVEYDTDHGNELILEAINSL